MSLRAAVLGTGAWARSIHLPGLANHPRVDLVGVWGRDPAAASVAAAQTGTRAFDDLDTLLAQVDLVSIAVTPAAQVPLAVAAAGAGAHLVLEKPAGPDAAGSRRLAEAVRAAGVEATVFLSRLWDPDRQSWLAREATTTWETIFYDWRSAGMRPGMPGAQGWRQDVGPLLDVAPHVVSIVEYLAGPVVAVESATTDRQERVLLTLRHRDGCLTTGRLDLLAPVPATQESLVLRSGGEESAWRNAAAVDFPAAYRAMVDDLLARTLDGAGWTPRGRESDLAHACGMAEHLDAAARLLAAEGFER